MQVSVIVCTRDRPDHLSRCLPSVLANDYSDFEVVVVDQSKDDASEKVISEIGDERIRYYRQDAAGKGRALNLALTHAGGSIMAHTDDDCTVPADWLIRCASAFTQAGGDTGLVFGALATPPIDWGQMFVPTFTPQTYRRLKGRSAFLRVPRIGVGANMSVRREVYDRLGGFDECMGPGSLFRSGDEWDLAYRALKAGFAVVQDPAITVTHWGRREYSDGSASRLLRNKYYGVGAGFTKHLRCGDPVAAYALGQLAVRDLLYSLPNLIRMRRETGAARLAYLARGMLSAVRHPIDHKGWIFIRTEG